MNESHYLTPNQENGGKGDGREKERIKKQLQLREANFSRGLRANYIYKVPHRLVTYTTVKIRAK